MISTATAKHVRRRLFDQWKPPRHDNKTCSISTAFPAAFPHRHEPQDDHQRKQRHLQIQHRSYHATSKREILPLLVVGLGVGFVVRYSFKALQRMDEEWEEYQWQLQQYEKAHRNDIINQKGKKFPDGTLAVDVGTATLKLAHNGNGLLVSREGARTTFCGVVYPDKDDDSSVIVGQAALEKYWQVPESQTAMVRPIPPPKSSTNQSTVLLQVVTPAIQDALERANLQQSKMRSVVAVPPSAVDKPNDDPRNPWTALQNNNHNTINTTWQEAEWIPEPVAAVWGAQVHGELPLHLDFKKPVLVVDIGGHVTHLSVVQKDVVVATVSLDFGGNAFIDAICEYVIANGPPQLKTIRNDGMAWQQLVRAAQTAVQELNTQSYTNLNIPYIGMDLETRQPIHLDMNIGRSMLEQQVTNQIVNDVIVQYQTTDGDSSSSTNDAESTVLSPHVPVVTHSLSSLWMSLMTQLLTDIQLLPQDLGHVLLVGGGAKHPLMVQSIKECFGLFQTNVVVPELATRSELVVLGASSILPPYEYDFEAGLIRLEDPSDEAKEDK